MVAKKPNRYNKAAQLAPTEHPHGTPDVQKRGYGLLLELWGELRAVVAFSLLRLGLCSKKSRDVSF